MKNEAYGLWDASDDMNTVAVELCDLGALITVLSEHLDREMNFLSPKVISVNAFLDRHYMSEALLQAISDKICSVREFAEKASDKGFEAVAAERSATKTTE